MKSFQQFIAEAYDKELEGQASRAPGEGGRIRASRKKRDIDKTRVKAVGGGKTAPAADYKPRKDIGTQRSQSDRVQQPTRERGSAKLSPREQQRKAAQERRAAKSDGKSKKDLEKAASKLLTKKTTKAANPNYKPQKASGYSHAERLKLRRASDRLLRDIAKGKEKPAAHYDPKVKKPS